MNWVRLLACGLVLSGCSSAPAPSQGTGSGVGLGSIPKTACGFPMGAGETEGQGVQCGTLDVPASYQDPSKGTYHLHVAVYQSSTAKKGALPVILLLGGPGDSIQLYAKAFTKQLMDALGHEVIVFDQRGAGQSIPAPLCSKQASLLDAPATVSSALASCVSDAKSQGVDLTTFDTLASANDVDRLKKALGLTHYALVGWSYGTRLALQTLRLHPDGISALMLDSVTTPDQTPPETKGPLVDAALSDLIATCQQTKSCNKPFPNLGQKISETTAALPVPWPSGPGGTFTKVMYAALLTQLMARSTTPLYDVASYITQVDAAVVGQGQLPDNATTANLATALGAATMPSEAMYYSITCSDDQTADPATSKASLTGVRPALAAFFQHTNDVIFASCAKWPFAKHPASAFVAVKSAVPSLLFTTRFDTAATAGWAEHAASTLSHSTLVRFTNAAHIVTATDTSGCALSILKQFLDSPGGKLDTTCVQ